jgi:hypothetical protein
MASILVADELAEARKALEGRRPAAADSDPADLDAIVRRIEGIAARLESS